jgi:imidazoleglycerol-phosphate dehydratase/histidinol-phosphatase
MGNQTKKKVLFIDRDGTLIVEPPEDFQVDSLEKLEFLPGVFRYLSDIVKELDYELVMVTNQDGLGTDSFPEDTFWPAQNKMLKALENEGITFSEILIDRSFQNENLPTRKPGTALLANYFSKAYDLENSAVIGDRLSDIQLAKNLGAQGIFIGTEENGNNDCDLITSGWEGIYNFLKQPPRTATLKRKTNETDIEIKVDLEGGNANINTGIKFFDHMLDQLSRHGGIGLDIAVKGDLEVDEHHTIEDTAIALGEAFADALGDKRGIERYGFCLPMDDCLAQVAIDFGGRNWMEWDAQFNREMVGKMPTEMFFHFFKSFSDGARCNLNIKAEGINEHHKIEAIFKAFAKAIKTAVKRDVNCDWLPTTKGVL